MESQESQNSGDLHGGIVTARGKGDGLVIRLDGRVESSDLKEALLEFIESRESFLSGHEVSLEWVGSKPEEGFVAEISDLLSSSYGIRVRGSKLKEMDLSFQAEEEESFVKSKPSGAGLGPRSISLFSGIGSLGGEGSSGKSAKGGSASSKSMGGIDVAAWDDADARIIYGTLRSGQRIETEHSVVVLGDVNSGAEIVAGGDIIVMGTLRGVGHAGAYDETGGGRVIIALNLQPTQLRIGLVISRGVGEARSVPEIARVDSDIILVEPYQVKSFLASTRGL